MKHAIKFTALALVFVMGLAAVLMGLSRIFVPKTNAQGSGIMDPAANGILGEKKNTVDVLFLGDSESHSSIVPMKLWKDYGFASYCCATSAQKLCYTEQLMRNAFSKHKPKIVVLETDAIFRNFGLADSLVHGSNNLFPIFTYHNRWKTLKANDLSARPKYTHTDATRGYAFNIDQNPVTPKNYMSPSKRKERVSRMNMHYLQNILKYCEKNGAKLVLVSTPSTVNWNMKRHNRIQKFASDNGVEYLDLNLMRQQVPIDWNTDTRDRGDHLNYFGAVKVTGYLGKYIESTGLVKSHRGEAKYAGWEKDCKTFYKTVSAILPHAAQY